MHFGDLLKRFREERQWTLRDLGTLSEVDHAYIYRLETGEKSTPSAAVITALSTALKLDRRTAHILRWLADQEAPGGLVDLVLEDPAYALADFAAVAAMSHQGARPHTKEDWRRRLTLVRGVREEFEKPA